MKVKHMRPALRRTDKASTTVLPLLCNGDRLTQPEFHRRYLTYPDDVHFRLIGGIVYVPSPKRVRHSDYDGELGFVYGLYRRSTPGIGELHSPTTILGEESEPEPDLGLRILEEYGGRSYVDDKGYLNGSAELLSEIAHSTAAIDMHLKKTDYEAAGVAEYLVICVAEQQLHWFDFAKPRLILPDAKGIHRSRIFPGLWIDGPALLARQSDRLVRVAKQGLASPEHAAFVKRLQAARRKHKSK